MYWPTIVQHAFDSPTQVTYSKTIMSKHIIHEACSAILRYPAKNITSEPHQLSKQPMIAAWKESDKWFPNPWNDLLSGQNTPSEIDVS